MIKEHAFGGIQAIRGMKQMCVMAVLSGMLGACASGPPPSDSGERPIPPGIERRIHPNVTTQDQVLALLGKPVARLMESTDHGHVHVWTYSYLDTENPQGSKSEALTITFDDKTFVVLSVKRGPL